MVASFPLSSAGRFLHHAVFFLGIAMIGLWALVASTCNYENHISSTKELKQVYKSPPAFARVFPLQPDGSVVDLSIARPFRKEICAIWLATCLGLGIPSISIAASWFLLRNWQDVYVGLKGLLLSAACAAWFQAHLKWMVGGLRPHLIDVCQPDIQKPPAFVVANILYYKSSVCSGDDKVIREAFQSFPSGHSTVAFAGFGFLSLWLFAAQRYHANAAIQDSCLVYFIFVFWPLLAATVMAGLLTIDHYHHASDIIAGSFIGIGSAACAYHWCRSQRSLNMRVGESADQNAKAENSTA